MANLIMENTYFNVYCPDFSQWPYEVWITPKVVIKKFGDINDDQIKDLAEIMQKLMLRLKKIHAGGQFAKIPFSYNYYIHPKENWYLRLIPRFVHRAGFELGTGLQVNIIDPTKAAEEYMGFDEKKDKIMNKLQTLSKK
jgi:UDPglucose--hexose-1-phosphate uridylyltransferase